MVGKIVYAVGQKYHRLTLLSKVAGKNAWLMRCECGGEISIAPNQASSGHTKSCGCYRKEIKCYFTHGMSETLEYYAWCGLRNRCNKPQNPKYKYYGGRGIKVCDRWMGSEGFANFYADMGPKPKNHSLDRIDPNGNYEPSNCQWATDKQQSRNRRFMKTVMLNGETITRAEAEEILGICLGSIQQKKDKTKLSLQEATDYFSKKMKQPEVFYDNGQMLGFLSMGC